MFNETSSIFKLALSILFFPLFFQNAFLSFAWGLGDQFWVSMGKRLFLLLPVLAFILGCWISMACLLTVLIRQQRVAFLTALLVTWWDLGKSIIYFWGGIINFFFNLAVAVVGLFKVAVFGLWSVVQEIIYTPFRLIKGVSQNVLSSPVPWVAVFMTFFWCLIEAFIFTYVTTPLVVDTFSNITGENLPVNFIRIPLFLFLLFMILGSYAVLSTFVESIKKKNISSIAGIGVIEVVVLFVEVVFLYREFVDSLVPWFAQYSENFQLGILGTLGISCFVWFGIRSLSWFLFAAHGTPTIMYIIQGKGVVIFSGSETTKSRLLGVSSEFVNRIKEETHWIQLKGEELLASFILPPLQVIAAAINFGTLLLSSNHLFDLPFTNLRSIKNSKDLIDNISRRMKPGNEVHEKIGDYQNV